MKRIVCFLLAIFTIMSMVPGTALTANAASDRKTSTKAIKVLMEHETFNEKEYEIGGKWYIGYGSPVEKGSFKNSITKDKALELMRDHISDMVDDDINAFTKKNNLDLSQHQHDALAVYSYRMGTSWITSGHPLYEAVRTGRTGNNFINVIAQYHGADVDHYDDLKAGINRRLSEAAMYLDNSYGYNPPSNYTFAVLSIDGNETYDSGDTVVAYNTSKGYKLSPMDDADFLGWYVFDGDNDGKIKGEPITKLDKDTARKLIVAKLKTVGSEAYASYKINSSSLISRNVYKKAYTEAEYKKNISEKKIGTLKSNTTFKVTKEVMVDGIKWAYGTGKDTKDKEIKGYVYLGELEAPSSGSSTPIASATITVSSTEVREGATADSDVLTTLKKGDTVSIFEIKNEKSETGNKNWGRVSFKGYKGWINLAHADVLENSGSSDSPIGKKGKIINCNEVNVREDAGVNNKKLTTLKKGTEVKVLKTKMVGSTQWGQIEWDSLKDGYTKGWVYMYYVEVKGLEHSDAAGSTSSKEDKVLYTGVVTSNINLNVRKKADIYSTQVDSLPTGTKINVYETTTNRNMKWGRIGENRWVCLAYVNLTEVTSSGSGSTGTTSTTTKTTTEATVTSATLDVLKNYNNNAQKVGSLKKGDVVTILEKNTETTETGSRIWGRFSKNGLAGWINLAYVDLKTVTTVSGGNTSGSASAGTNNANGANSVIANCISVNVREGAGVANAQITKLNNGTAIKVYNQVTKDNAPWAKITWDNGKNEGWVCMNYVTMTTTNTNENGVINGTNSNTISVTGTVNSNIDLNVRGSAGLGGNKIGTLKKGAKVTVYEQVTADGLVWGRINYGNGSGWVCMSYITVDSASSTGKGVMGTIARCFAAVNVRSAPGTNNALINKINVGTRVEVFETKTHSNQLWGRVAQGWICMDYVLLDSELPEGEILDATVPTTEATKETEPVEETINRDDEVLYTIIGKVLADPLNVRNDADADSIKVGTVKKNETVKVLAVKANGAELWGRIDQYATAGWINLVYVDYKVEGFVNTEEQPVYADPNTSSTVKGNLAINTPATIKKLMVNGTTVYGWYEDAALAGWIPMGRISDEQTKAIPVITTSTVDCFANKIIGTTNAAVDAYDEANGKEVLVKLKSGVNVYVGEIDLEGGVVWGKVAYNNNGTDTPAWINMNSVTYTLTGTLTEDINVYKSKLEDDDNILGEEDDKLEAGNTVTICELSFDINGHAWGKVTGTGKAILNGGYIPMDAVNNTTVKIDAN